MTQVPERPLSYGERLEKLRKLSRYSPPSKAFAEVEYTRTTIKTPSGFVKKYKLKDKSLISEQIAHQNHVRSIRYES